MKKELAEKISYFAVKEEEAMRLLDNHFKCLEEEYGIEISVEKATPIETQANCLVCVGYQAVPEAEREGVCHILESILPALITYGEQRYIEQELDQKKYLKKEDVLTGVWCKEYLMSRADIINRAEIMPTTVIAVRVKGWNSIVGKYGMESGECLVQLASTIILKAAKDDFLVGRVDENVFAILIPMVREGEAREYCRCLEKACYEYRDCALAPSFEIEMETKYTIWETLREKIEKAVKSVEKKDRAMA